MRFQRETEKKSGISTLHILSSLMAFKHMLRADIHRRFHDEGNDRTG
jgi:hypothetical protein